MGALPRQGENSSNVCPKTGHVIPPQPHTRWLVWLYALSGVSALVWFLVRVIPKPSRATYPCQRLAFPMATSFLLWVAGLAGTIFAFRKAGAYLRQARYTVAGLCLAGALAIACWALSLPGESVSAAWSPSDPPNTPMGTAKGINPGRVVWVHEPAATNWDGSSNYWWNDVNTDQAVVDAMVANAIHRLSGASTDAAAWDALFRHFNQTHGRGDTGYQAGEGIAIKINMNVAGDYNLTNEPIVSPQVVRALVWQLVEQASVTESAICIYDASRRINDAVYNPTHAEFPQVRFIDTNGGRTGRTQVTRAAANPVHYGDTSVSYSGSTYLPACVVNASYLINLALLRGHSLAGVTLCAKNHFGSVYRGGSWSPSHIHDSIDRNQQMATANSLVDLMGHEHLDGKALLFMIDALYAAVNQGASRPSRWRMSPFDNDWTSSIFVSQDGVAMDSVAVDFCRTEPTLSGQVTGNGVDNYLHEAALAHDPPSGAVYDPEGDGTPLASLGVHEHWNNAQDMQYSRDLGTGNGIELVRISGVGGFRRGDANADGEVNISDAIMTLLHLFAGEDRLTCLSSADANDSGSVDIADAVYTLSYLFVGGPPPADPFSVCGPDPTPDDLTCESYAPCGAPVTPAGKTVKLVTTESPATILIPGDGALGLDWTQSTFDDAGWLDGVAAVGYDENDTYQSHITTDLMAQMNGVNTTAYIRIPFTLAEELAVNRLTLPVKYDDGFVVYLNGVRVADRNAPADLSWASAATGQNGDDLAVFFEPVDITDSKDLLTVGPNVLALHGLNASLTSSDFLIAVELEARVPEDE